MTSPLTFAAGDLTVHRIVEMSGPTMGIQQMLPGLTDAMLAEHRGWLAPDSLDADDRAIMNFQCYVVRTPHHNILIDSCIGNDKTMPPHMADWHKRQGREYELALEAAGLRYEDIDYVFCTHLHADHVGSRPMRCGSGRGSMRRRGRRCSWNPCCRCWRRGGLTWFRMTR